MMIGMSIPGGPRAVVAALVIAGGLAGAFAYDTMRGQASAEVLEIVATGTSFDAPSTVGSGWTRIRFENRSGEPHFVVLEKLPEGRTLADSERDVVPVFQEGMNLLIEGRTDEALARFGDLPEWYGEMVFLGGPGLTAAGRTSEVVVNLEPGTYVLECYVKTADGEFHSFLGMVHELTVTPHTTNAVEPTATLALRVANDGITFEGTPSAGSHVVGVHFEEQMVHGNFLGSDVHLVRLEDDTDVDAVAAWMNWAAPTGLASPAPAEFVTGMHEMPPGHTGYIDVELVPGEYAWIAEVDDPAGKSMLRRFTVR